MLLTAGFSAPAPIEIPFAERVQTAQQLRADGLLWAEIGELLGVGADTARRYMHAHPCDCGEPILARHARLCRRCSSRDKTRWGRVFTEPEILAAIRLWAKLEGRAPRSLTGARLTRAATRDGSATAHGFRREAM